MPWTEWNLLLICNTMLPSHQLPVLVVAFSSSEWACVEGVGVCGVAGFCSCFSLLLGFYANGLR